MVFAGATRLSTAGKGIGLRAAGLVVALGWLAAAPAGAETITLKNGMRLEGSVTTVSTLGGDPLTPTGAGEVKLSRIVLVDNQLTRTFVGTNQVVAVDTPPPVATEKISVKQRVAISGHAIGDVGSPVRIDPFDEWGRRIFSMRTARGPLDLVQGITEVTPTWTKVEAIQGTKSYIWTMRIATSSIPREQLSRILYNVIDPKNSDDRLRIVRLYMQSERFKDARAELEQLLKEFPDLAPLKDQVKVLRQLESQRLLKEIELRLAAGQPRLAITMLQQFPAEGVAGETLLKVRETLQGLAAQAEKGNRLKQQLAAHLAALPADAGRDDLQPLVDEIARDLTIHTLDRMADYLRLADDPALAPQQKLSLAISGWLLGSGSAVENLAVTKSLIRVRDIVRRYLASNRKPERDALLDELTSQEGASPAYVAKLIAHMKPPLPAGPDAVAPADVANPAALLDLPTGGSDKPAGAPSPKPDARTVAPPPGDGCEPNLPAAESTPATAAPKAPPAATLAQPAALPAVPAPAPGPEPSAPPAAPQPLGLHELAVKGVPEEPEFKYWLQLPPEYDPYRRYPCIVTLNGAGTTPLQQIDWWAGSYVPEMQTRYGQASRHGYIVLAPRWTREYQRRYEFSAREWAAVLYTLQDACKRFAIDTDRVFLSGHSMGGDAVWDMGLSHPSLWAGVIPIVATADKYVARYWRNGKYVPMYFVSGEKDGGRWAQNSTEWDRYLTYTGFDTTVVQYQGRGHEHFHDEIQNLFAWMNLHKRNFFPREIDMDTLRPWDNFFWWVEVRDPQDTTVILPAEWGSGSKSAKSARPAQIEARVLETNTLTVRAGAHRRVAVWLSPDIVSFEGKSPTVRINNKPQSKIQPSLPVLLEDVRLRGDRQHPFWAKVEN